jgi:3-hydroxyisobutyrate dehydrogenase-like beta-hydroxyacid dehydrogenase
MDWLAEETMAETIGILHPGEMGVFVAASAQNSGHALYWASQGRSAATRERAERHGLRDAQSLQRLCAACSIVVSVCPPEAAEEVAHEVLARGFRGLYVDANAIAPQRARQIEAAMDAAGADFVDGGIIGGPAWQRGSTWLYLAGAQAGRVAACFSAGPLQAQVIGDTPGKASALKICYAAYSKGTTALLAAILAAADAWDVGPELAEQWSRDGSGLADQAPRRVRAVTAKAWRFAGEMDEIAATFAAVGLPAGFHQAAAALYRRLAGFKDQEDTTSLAAVLAALRRDEADGA